MGHFCTVSCQQQVRIAIQRKSTQDICSTIIRQLTPRRSVGKDELIVLTRGLIIASDSDVMPSFYVRSNGNETM